MRRAHCLPLRTQNWVTFSVEAAVSAATKHSAGDTPATTVTDE
jgi:hypothetical protein